MKKILVVNVLFCVIGMTVLELPILMEFQCRAYISSSCVLFSIGMYMFILHKDFRMIDKKDLLLFGIIILLEFVLFRIIMNYIYNEIFHIGDNYAIFFSIVYYGIYNMMYFIVYCIEYLIRKFFEPTNK